MKYYLDTFQGQNSINRNILECKSMTKNEAIESILVLIETYWNVNQGYLHSVRPPL
ncbi:hypothetical protein BLAHAN_04043 [Blautia hansenii DSM 20583]|uniref:Uncharacterized protein n=1 Tax=Blautia hansenii DSM 20583 TaxID=537007 RepID=C9L3V6_BLAHA|nr:hypothetical protein BLAHAN_04043 [Blautia hansenii DSM 20583]